MDSDGEEDAAPHKDVSLALERAKAMEGFRYPDGTTMPKVLGPVIDLGASSIGLALLFLTIRLLAIGMIVAGVATLHTLMAYYSFRKDADVFFMRFAQGPMRDWLDPSVHNRTDFLEGYRISELDTFFAYHIAMPNALIALMFTIFIIYLFRQLRTVGAAVDHAHITTGDYAIEARDVPANGVNEKELIKYFETQGKAKVASLEIAYACGEYSHKLEEWEAAHVHYMERRAKHKAKPTDKTAAKLAASTEKVEAVEAELKALAQAPRVPTGVVYVIYDTEQGRNRCLDRHNPAFIWFLLDMVLPCCRFRPRYKGKKLAVAAAPEPGDVYWINLHVPRSRVQLLAARTLFLALCLIGVAFGIFIGLDILSDWVVDKAEERAEAFLAGGDHEESARVTTGVFVVKQVAANVMGLLINVFDGWIDDTVFSMTKSEHRYTRTDFEESYYVKTAVVQVVNATILLFAVAAVAPAVTKDEPEGWYSDEGLMNAAFSAILINALVPSLQMALPVDSYVNRLVRARFAHSRAKLDALYAPSEFPFTKTYIEVTKTVALALIFGPMMPLVWFVTSFALVTKYIFGRYAFARVTANPPVLSVGIAERFTTLFSLLIGTSLLIQLFLYDQGARVQADEAVGPVVLALLAWAAIALLPKRMIPGLSPYVTNSKKELDTDGKLFSSNPLLPRYRCPITEPVPSYKNAEAAVTAELRARRRSDGPEDTAKGGPVEPAVTETDVDARGRRVCCGLGPRRKPRPQQML